MRIKWWGHASFLLTTESGFSILTDPYYPQMGYAGITDEPDLVTVSHDHSDHNSYRDIAGEPVVMEDHGPREFDGVRVRGVSTYHDRDGGRERGANTVFILQTPSHTVVHLGDLGHLLSGEELEEIGAVDILLVPVGGHFTIGPGEARTTVEAIDPALAIPMHYKTENIDLPIAGVEGFTTLYPAGRVRRFDREEIECTSLPDTLEIWVPSPAGR